MSHTQLQEIESKNERKKKIESEVTSETTGSTDLEESDVILKNREGSEVFEELKSRDDSEVGDQNGKEKIDEPVEKNIDEPLEKKIDEPLEKNIDEPVEKKIDEPLENIDEPVEKKEAIREEIQDNILTEEIIKGGISLLRRIGNGLSYSFIQLDMTDRKLTDILILEKYIHLRIVDISNNYLTDLKPFNCLNDLLDLKANYNNIVSLILEPRPFLQYISVNNNRIRDISEGLSHPLIRYIDLSSNDIRELPPFDGSGLLHLTILKLERNMIQNIENFNIPNLKILHLGYNMIADVQWISDLVNLEELNLNSNMIETTDGFHSGMEQLKYIDLKENKIAKLQELNPLSSLPELNTLQLTENPLARDGDYRVEVLAIIKVLKVLDEEEFIDEEQADARDIVKQRHENELIQNEENFP